MKAVSLVALLWLAGCVDPAPRALEARASSAGEPPASASELRRRKCHGLPDHVVTDSFELGGTWISVSLQRGSSDKPIVSSSIVTPFDPGVDASSVDVKLISRSDRLALLEAPNAGLLPVGGSFARGAGTAWASFTFENATSAPLTAIELTFKGETRRLEVASLKRFPEEFAATQSIGSAASG